MKLKKTGHAFHLPKMILLAAVTCMTQSNLSASTHDGGIFISKKSYEDDKKPSRKEKSFKNANVVKVYPDMIRRAIHVTARNSNEKEIEFLVFDVSGNMVLNYKMKAGERKTIDDLKKGSYMYHVFADDEYLTTGKIVIK